MRLFFLELLAGGSEKVISSSNSQDSIPNGHSLSRLSSRLVDSAVLRPEMSRMMTNASDDVKRSGTLHPAYLKIPFPLRDPRKSVIKGSGGQAGHSSSPAHWEQSIRSVFVAQSSPVSKKPKKQSPTPSEAEEEVSQPPTPAETKQERAKRLKGRMLARDIWGPTQLGAVQRIRAERGKYEELESYKKKHREIRKIREELEESIKRMHADSSLPTDLQIQKSSFPSGGLPKIEPESQSIRRKVSIHNERIKLFAREGRTFSRFAEKAQQAGISSSQIGQLEPNDIVSKKERTLTKNTSLIDVSQTDRRDSSVAGTELHPAIQVNAPNSVEESRNSRVKQATDKISLISKSVSLPPQAFSDRAIRLPPVWSGTEHSQPHHLPASKEENKYVPRKSLRGSFRVSFRSNLPGESLMVPQQKSPLRLLSKDPEVRRSVDFSTRPSRVNLFPSNSRRDSFHQSLVKATDRAVPNPSRFKQVALGEDGVRNKKASQVEGPSQHSEIQQVWTPSHRKQSFKPFSFVDDTMTRIEKIQERLWQDPLISQKASNTIPSIILPKQDEQLVEEGTMQMSKLIKDTVAKSYEKLRKRSTHYTDRVETSSALPHLGHNRSKSQQSLDAVQSLLAKAEGIVRVCESVCSTPTVRTPMRELVQRRYRAIDTLLRGASVVGKTDTSPSLETNSLPEQHLVRWESSSQNPDREDLSSEFQTRRVLLESSDMIIEGKVRTATRNLGFASTDKENGLAAVGMSKQKQQTVLFLKNVREGNGQLAKEGFILL